MSTKSNKPTISTATWPASRDAWHRYTALEIHAGVADIFTGKPRTDCLPRVPLRNEILPARYGGAPMFATGAAGNAEFATAILTRSLSKWEKFIFSFFFRGGLDLIFLFFEFIFESFPSGFRTGRNLHMLKIVYLAICCQFVCICIRFWHLYLYCMLRALSWVNIVYTYSRYLVTYI